MDVQIKFRIEESVTRMGLYRRGGHVNMKDAQANLRKEEFVLNMGLLRRERLALSRGGGLCARHHKLSNGGLYLSSN